MLRVVGLLDYALFFETTFKEQIHKVYSGEWVSKKIQMYGCNGVKSPMIGRIFFRNPKNIVLISFSPTSEKFSGISRSSHLISQ